jgi:hypothetical protein
MNLHAFSRRLQQRRCNGLYLRSGVFAFVAATSIFGFIALLNTHAQSPALIPGPLDGRWMNISTGTTGLAEIDIHGLEIHLFGDCNPRPCDWGVAEARGYASSVRSSEISALFFHRVTNFNEVEIAISLERDGLLRVETFTHFTDSSRRADYHMVDFFERERAPSKP